MPPGEAGCLPPGAVAPAGTPPTPGTPGAHLGKRKARHPAKAPKAKSAKVKSAKSKHPAKVKPAVNGARTKPSAPPPCSRPGPQSPKP
jgi:hypothetical protein